MADPVNRRKAKNQKKSDILQSLIGQESGDDDSEKEAADATDALTKAMKGKAKASGDELTSDEEEDEDGLEVDEVVICTLDPEKVWSQTFDISF